MLGMKRGSGRRALGTVDVTARLSLLPETASSLGASGADIGSSTSVTMNTPLLVSVPS